MGIKRTPDGNIMDEPTQKIGGGGQPARPITPPGRGGGVSSNFDEPTQVIGKGNRGKPRNLVPPSGGGYNPGAQDDDDDKTRVVGGKRKKKDQGSAPQQQYGRPDDNTVIYGSETEETDPMEDPIVGWLVTISGPGKGHILKLGYGMNSIGRGDDVRQKIIFDDGEISRKTHCTMTFDPKGRRFFLQHGEGTNLTYLGGDPVLSPTQIDNGAIISMGSSDFRFMAFCDENFDWQDQE